MNIDMTILDHYAHLIQCTTIEYEKQVAMWMNRPIEDRKHGFPPHILQLSEHLDRLLLVYRAIRYEQR